MKTFSWSSFDVVCFFSSAKSVEGGVGTVAEWQRYGLSIAVGWDLGWTARITSGAGRWMDATWRASDGLQGNGWQLCARASHAGSKPPRVRRVQAARVFSRGSASALDRWITTDAAAHEERRHQLGFSFDLGFVIEFWIRAIYLLFGL